MKDTQLKLNEHFFRDHAPTFHYDATLLHQRLKNYLAITFHDVEKIELEQSHIAIWFDENKTTSKAIFSHIREWLDVQKKVRYPHMIYNKDDEKFCVYFNDKDDSFSLFETTDKNEAIDALMTGETQ